MNKKQSPSAARCRGILTVTLFVLASSFLPMAVGAADNTTVNISITGNVVSNALCTFGSNEMTVDFGPIHLNRTGADTFQMDGSYIKSLASDFVCTGDTSGLNIELQAGSEGYTTYESRKVLATEKGIVGIELLVDGAPVNAGESIAFDALTPPTLQAQLVQVGSTSENLTSGETFSTAASLIMSFE